MYDFNFQTTIFIMVVLGMPLWYSVNTGQNFYSKLAYPQTHLASEFPISFFRMHTKLVLCYFEPLYLPILKMIPRIVNPTNVFKIQLLWSL